MFFYKMSVSISHSRRLMQCVKQQPLTCKKALYANRVIKAFAAMFGNERNSQRLSVFGLPKAQRHFAFAVVYNESAAALWWKRDPDEDSRDFVMTREERRVRKHYYIGVDHDDHEASGLSE